MRSGSPSGVGHEAIVHAFPKGSVCVNLPWSPPSETSQPGPFLHARPRSTARKQHAAPFAATAIHGCIGSANPSSDFRTLRYVAGDCSVALDEMNRIRKASVQIVHGRNSRAIDHAVIVGELRTHQLGKLGGVLVARSDRGRVMTPE